MKSQVPFSVVFIISLSAVIFAQASRPNIGDKAKVVLLTGDTVAGAIAFITDSSVRLKTAFGEMNFARAECRTLLLEKPAVAAASAAPAAIQEPIPSQQATPVLPVMGEKKTITLKNGDKLEGAIVVMTLDAVTVRTLFGDIAVPKANIESIEDVQSAVRAVPVEPVSVPKPAPAPEVAKTGGAGGWGTNEPAPAGQPPVQNPVPAAPQKAAVKRGWGSPEAAAESPSQPAKRSLFSAAALAGAKKSIAPAAAVLPLRTAGMSLAVLPFANNTTDLAAGELARLLFALGIKEKGYQVIDIDTVDAKLRELGISEGGQLGGIPDSVLVNALQVEGLAYGTLLEAEYSTKAVSSTKKVTVAVTILKNGQTFFSDQQTAKHSQMGGSFNPLKALGGQIVDKTSEKAFAKYHGHPLELLIEEAIYKLQDKMPGTRVEKNGWTNNEGGGSMFGTTIIPSFFGPGIGFRGWNGKKNGWGLNIQPSWGFNNFLVQGRVMMALSSKMNSRWYLLGSPGWMWINESISLMGFTTDFSVNMFTIALGIGWEKLFGIRKNHGISFEGGLQLGSAKYKIKTSGSYGGYSMDLPEQENTYKASPIYIGAGYCYYFKHTSAPVASQESTETESGLKK
jgi:hypothetical protein